MNVQTNYHDCEVALDKGVLQILGHRGWYDVRRNGATKASIPVKVGFRQAFRLEFDNTAGGCGMALRVRPNDFDPRTRR